MNGHLRVHAVDLNVLITHCYAVFTVDDISIQASVLLVPPESSGMTFHYYSSSTALSQLQRQFEFLYCLIKDELLLLLTYSPFVDNAMKWKFKEIKMRPVRERHYNLRSFFIIDYDGIILCVLFT